MKKSSIKRLAVSAIFIALAAVLSFVKIWQNPWGGSITLLSMVPIVLISALFGVRWGVFSSFVYALVQIALDVTGMMSWGMDARMWAGGIIFDYLIAYTAIGLAGVFRNKGSFGLCAGTVFALVVRFISHAISGCIFFDVWMPETFDNVFIYTVVYNGTYMLPEIIFTAIAIFILYKTNTIKRISEIVNR